MSWDSWLIPVKEEIGAEHEAKRLRTEVFGAAPAFPAPAAPAALLQTLGWPQPALLAAPTFPSAPGLCGFAMTAPPPPPPPSAPAPGAGADITRRIVEQLHSRLGAQATASSPRAAAPTGSELGTMLLDSLRGLLPNGQSVAACQSSDAGQELLRVAQQSLAPAPLVPMPVKVEAPVKVEVPEPQPPPVKLEEPPDEPPPPLQAIDDRAAQFAPELDCPRRDEDAESDDGVPHRLPPGFGAIPEDIVEERARQREEARILQLKATQPCRFGRRCKKRDCPNAHPEGRDIDTTWNPCAFGRRCKRKGCFYDHPEGRIIDDNPEEGMCKFGARCSRPDCLYDHPEGRVPVAGPDPRICFFCHDLGHIAADCSRNPESWNFNREGQGQIVVVSSQKAIAGQ